MVRENVIFEVTKDHLQSGLRGIPVGFCSTSYVDETKGLFYAGRPIFEVITWKPAGVIYLLMHGEEADPKTLLAFEKELSQRSKISSVFHERIKTFPKDMDPLILFAQALLNISNEEKTNNIKEDCINLIAKAPTIAAAIINHIEDTDMPNVDMEKDYMHRFANLLDINCEKIIDLFNVINILHFDHGGGVADAFVGKIVSSCKTDIFSSIAAAIIAFSGAINGKASAYSLQFLRSLSDSSDNLSQEMLSVAINEKLKNKEKIYGFGYPDLKTEDSRATLLYNYARKHFPNHPLIKTALLLRYEARKLFVEKKIDVFANVDAISGAVFLAAGYEKEKYYPLICSIARSVGIAIQIYHEKSSPFNEKDMKLFHPYYFYRSRG